jgi:hypothetical protein
LKKQALAVRIIAVADADFEKKSAWRGVGAADRAALEMLCAEFPYRGFESRPLRSTFCLGSAGFEHAWCASTRARGFDTPKASREANPALSVLCAVGIMPEKLHYFQDSFVPDL